MRKIDRHMRITNYFKKLFGEKERTYREKVRNFSALTRQEKNELIQAEAKEFAKKYGEVINKLAHE